MLSSVEQLITAFSNLVMSYALAIPFVASAVLVVFLRKRSELSKLALLNTYATLVVYGVNMLLLILFWEHIDWAMQSVYQALHIPTLPRSIWQGWPFVATVVIGIAFRDLVDYWSHRFMHLQLFWPLHAAHHSDTHVNGFTAFRIHFLETIFVTASQIVMLTWLQLPETIPAVAAFCIVLNVYVHLDVDWGHGPLKYLIASPRYHRWHHADVPAAYGKNLANVIPAYDVIFGTYYNPGPCHEQMGALASGVEDTSPAAILSFPFRAWYAQLRNVLPKDSANKDAPSAQQR